MPRISLDGIAIHYQQVGRGPDVVMVHGLGANLAFWNLRVVPGLASDFRVTTFDLRGHGRSDMPPRGYTIAEMAGDLNRLMKHLGLTPAHLVGHSFGALVVLHRALRQSAGVLSLTLADPVLPRLGFRRSRRDWRRFVVLDRELRRLEFSLPIEVWTDGHALLDSMAQPERRARGDASPGGPFVPFGFWNGGDRAANRWRQLVRTTSALTDLWTGSALTREELQRIRHPTLAVFGALSRYLPAREVLKDALPNCTTAVVPRAGHFYPLVNPEPFVRKLRDFLRVATPPGQPLEAPPDGNGAGPEQYASETTTTRHGSN